MDLFLRLNKGHSTRNIPVTAEEQATSSMFNTIGHDTYEFPIHLNEFLVVLLVNSRRTYFGDNGLQVICLREAPRLRGIQKLVAHEDRAMTDVARHGSRPWLGGNCPL